MKKIITILIVILVTITFIAHAQVENNVVTPNETKQENLVIGKYRLFKTTNRWTFLKLDTQNGRIWQVQYDIEGENRFETELNYLYLANIDEKVNNRFTLYPTQNMWTFILLDQLDGRMWQVQWSMEADQRFILMIK